MCIFIIWPCSPSPIVNMIISINSVARTVAGAQASLSEGTGQGLVDVPDGRKYP